MLLSTVAYRPYMGRLISALASFCIALVIAHSSPAVAQSEVADSPTFVHVDEFVPQEVPIRLHNSGLFNTIDNKSVLKFTSENTSVESLSSVQFLLLIVDESGNIKSGQGWRYEKPIGGLSIAEVQVELKYPVDKGNHIILTSYEVGGQSKTYSVTPTKVLFELSSKKLIKERKEFIKTVGAKLGQTNPCGPAQTAASAACTCGLKSFSCNPQTGQYSFSCFSKTENPSGCPEAPPEN